MSSLITLAIWMPSLLALFGYIATRRRLPSSRGLLAFDCGVFAIDILVCLGVFWRELTGLTPERNLLEQQLFLPLSLPIGVDIISVPLLLLAACFRVCLFSRPKLDL